MKKHILILSRIAISLVIIFIIWWSLKENTDELIATLSSANKLYLIIGFLIYNANILLLSIRLKIVLSTQNLSLKLKDSVLLNFIGLFFNSFLPTSIGGDIARGHYVSEKFNHKKVESYAAIFADRTIGLMSIISIALISLFIVGEGLVALNIRVSIFSIFALAVFFIFFSLNHRFASKFKFLFIIIKMLKLEKAARRVYGVFNNFKHHKKIGTFAFCVSLLSQIVIISVIFIISKSLSLELPFNIFFLFVPLISAASMIPSLGGTGPREGAFILLFSSLIGAPKAGALALLWLVYFLSLSLIGGVVYLLSGYHRLTLSEIEKEFNYGKERTA